MSQYIARIDGQLPLQGLGPVLYKLDSLGKLRTWRMELDQEGGAYRTLAGLDGGKQAVSGWTVCQAKSQASDGEQARFEVLAQYDHQLNREYHLTADTVSVPKMIEPMLAKTYDGWPGPGYAQPKLDGIRCIADVNGLWTRQGQPIVAVPHIHAALAPLFAADPDLILDGELYNHDLREDFGAISSIVRKKNPTAAQLEKAAEVMQYHVYDMVAPHSVFSIRTARVRELLNELNCGWILPVSTLRCETSNEADVIYGETCAAGYEGGMYRLDTAYELGRRSKSLLKRKEFITKEFRVGAIEEGNGNWAGAAKRMTLFLDDKEVVRFGAGIRGSYDKGVQLLKDWNDNPSWWPTATATVRFFMLSPDGVPRFPVVVDFQPNGRVD